MNLSKTATKVRAILSKDFESARWTSGGYMLRNKPSVHRDGFRIKIKKETKTIEVYLEASELMPLSLWKKVPGIQFNQDFKQLWSRRLTAVNEYYKVLQGQFACEIKNPSDYSRYPYLVIHGELD